MRLNRMTDLKLLQFPCRYPIKVMIRTGVAVREHLDAVVQRHAGPLAPDDITERPSAQQNFAGITYAITARDEAHIVALFVELKDLPGVLMVL